MRSMTRRGQVRVCLIGSGSRGSNIGCGQAAVIFLLLSLRPSSSTAIVGHDTCETDAQCLNGGFCVAVGTSGGSFQHCYCSEGYGGNRCEQYCPLLCRNGGVCHPNDKRGSDLLMREEVSSYRDEDFVCKCLGYFTGKLCDVPYENCSDGRRCLNGGQCVSGDLGSSTCFCQPDFFGSSCDVHVPVESFKQQQPTPSSSHTKIMTTPPGTVSSQPTITVTEKDSSNTKEKTQQTIPGGKYPKPTPFVQNQQENTKPVQKTPPSNDIPMATKPVTENSKFFSENKLLFTVSIGVVTFLLTVATGLLVQRRWHYRRVKSRHSSNECDQPYQWHSPSTDGSWKFVV